MPQFCACAVDIEGALAYGFGTIDIPIAAQCTIASGLCHNLWPFRDLTLDEFNVTELGKCRVDPSRPSYVKCNDFISACGARLDHRRSDESTSLSYKYTGHRSALCWRMTTVGLLSLCRRRFARQELFAEHWFVVGCWWQLPCAGGRRMHLGINMHIENIRSIRLNRMF